MKKLLVVLACVIFFMPVLTACGQQETTREYYYRFGDEAVREDGLLESFTYVITAEDKADSLYIRPLLEGEGTYGVMIYKTAPSSYKIETTFELTGSYVLYSGAAEEYRSEPFTDSITGTAIFSVDNDSFTVSSFEKTFLTTSVVVDGDSYKLVKYSYEIAGTYSGSTYKSSLSDIPLSGADEDIRISVESTENKDFTTTLSGRYADNETFFLLLRLQEFTTTFTDSFLIAEPFNAITPVKTWVARAVYDADKADYVEIRNSDIQGVDNAEYPDGIKCIRIDAALSDTNKGQDLVMYFSKDLSYRYAKTGSLGVIPNASETKLQLLMQFSSENLQYKLTEYRNYALTSED